MWNYLKASFFFWFGLIFVTVGTPFLLASIYELSVERDIAEHGIRTEATLVEKGHTTSRRGDSNYWLTYVFRINRAASRAAAHKCIGSSGGASRTATR